MTDFGDTESDSVKRPASLARGRLDPQLITVRKTWSEQSGYSFSEEWEGDYRAINNAFDNPNYVCGANQVIAQRATHSERANMTISFGHRTKEEARANYAQPEEFKSIWLLDATAVELPLWRHPEYRAILDDSPYQLHQVYPLCRQIWMATQQFISAWESRYATEVNEGIISVPIDQESLGQGVLRLSRPFDIWELVGRPTEGDIEHKLAVGRELADNILHGRSTYTQYRQTLQNRAVVSSNMGIGFSSANIPINYLYTNNHMIRIINSDIWGLENTRSRTPAGCRDVNAPKRALIASLRRDTSVGRYWRFLPPTTIELTNGSIEHSRNFIEMLPHEINETVTPIYTG